MIQVVLTIAILVLVLGGMLALSLSRKEGKELKKSCSCAIPGQESDGDSCVTSCN